MNKAKSLSKVTIKPQGTSRTSEYSSKVQQQEATTMKSSSFIQHFAISNGVTLSKPHKSKSPSMTSGFQNTAQISNQRRLSMKFQSNHLTGSMCEQKENKLQEIKQGLVSIKNSNSTNSKKRQLNYNSNTSTTRETPTINIAGLTTNKAKRKLSANNTQKESKHKRIISCQEPQGRKRNIDYLSESVANSTMGTNRMSFKSIHNESEFEQSQKYGTAQLSERRTSSIEDRTHNTFTFEYNSAPQPSRKVMNEQRMQEEIALIRQRQQQKADALVEQFAKLKKQAKEALDAQFQSLYQTQPVNVEVYEHRMDKFEKIIENLVDRQRQTQDELDQAKYMLRTKSSHQIDFGQTLHHLNKTTFGNLSLESSYKSISSKHLCKNHITQLGNTQQTVKDQCGVCSSQSTIDKRDRFNSPYLLDQTLPKKFQGISSIKPSSASTVKNYENISPDKKLLINAFTLNAQKSQQHQIKSFLDTLQNLEEGKQSKVELHAIREKLNTYKDQLKSCSKLGTKNEYNTKLQSLLENIIKKMDNQLANKNRLVISLDEENVNDSSVDKSKILCDTTQSPINALANISSVPNVSNNYIMVNTNYQPPTTNCDVSGMVDTSVSCISSRQRHLQKTCNRSGFLVKHSKDGTTYKVDPLNIYEHNQDEDAIGWQQEIKHIKSLLGAMAVDMDSKMATQSSAQFKDSQQCSIL